MADKSIIIRPNPFPGLRAFRPDEGHLFFGRTESTMKVVSKLKENRFVAVLGASGSGKSSLVMSGVVPALLKENFDGRKSWSYIVFRPDNNPIDQLARELSALSAGAGFSQLSEVSVAASLHNRTEGLIDIVNRIRKNLRQQVVIVVDQFEEIFRFSPVTTGGTLGDNATDFIDMIVNAVQMPDQGLSIILTLRSEYVSECSRFHSLTNLMNSSSYLLPQIAHDYLGTVIEEPMKVSGASIDRSLVRLIVNDMEDRPGQLPVLQHLMMRLWNQWSRSGDLNRPISVADYEAVGKLKGAISQHAGQALESLDERHRYVCSRLFRTIAVRNDDGREVRKAERISTIAELTGCGEDEIMHVAEVFRSPEYSFLTPSKEVSLSRETILDLSHESIIRLWNTLRKWMDEEVVSRKLYAQLAAAAEQYQEGNGRLWTGPDLMLALRWREDNRPTVAWAEQIDPAYERAMLFLKNSEEEYAVQEEYRRKSGRIRIKRTRMIAGLMGLISLIALAALVTVYSLRNRAEKQKSVAMQMKEEAFALNDKLRDSLNLLADTLETVTVLTDLERQNALAAEAKALMAEEKAGAAQASVREMTAGKAAALKKVSEENRFRMLSLARSLAVRSINHAGEKDLQILLALQSFIFNDRYSGFTEDADVFSALYEVSKLYGNRFYNQFTPDMADVTAMAEGPDGRLFTADTRGRVLRWLVDRPALGYDVIWSGDKIVRVMTLSPDASWLACGTEKSGIIMIPVDDDTIGYQMQDSCCEITSLIFAGDGEKLYYSATTGGVNEWDLRTRKSRQIIDDESGIRALEASRDMGLLAALTDDGKVLLWTTGQTGKLSTLESGDRVITSHKFVPGSNRLATGDNSGMIEIWNTSTKRIVSSIEGHNSPVRAFAFDDTDGQMLTADDSGVIKLWTMANLSQPPVHFSDSRGKILSMIFCNDGDAFLTASESNVTRRPAHIRCMTDGLCDKVTRNLSLQEWSAFVGQDIDYEATCHGEAYTIRVREVRGAR
jgi:WD40 repeat protein/energy-coupling factor transporter ATP-binding protein EcfA2